MIFIEMVWIRAATLVTFVGGQVIMYMALKQDRKIDIIKR